MRENNLFWRTDRGELPVPACAITLGMTIKEVDPDKGTLSAEFIAPDTFLNPAGGVQGGFICSMLDETIGCCILSTLDENEVGPTVNLNVSFLSPARAGALNGQATIIEKVGRQIIVSATLQQDGNVIAVAQASSTIRKLL